MHTIQRFVGVVALLCLGGCGVSGPPFHKISIPEGRGVTYVYRPHSFFGSALSPNVSCGSAAASLGPGGYFAFDSAPGRLVCSAATEARSEVDVEVRAGAETYVKEQIGWGFFVGRPHLYLTDTQTGEREIQGCKQQQ